jgi:Zn-dependent protease with chaperone function
MRNQIGIEGLYYDGRNPAVHSATLLLNRVDATLICGQTSGSYRIRHLDVSPRIGSADRFITLPDGGQFQCADHPGLDRLKQESSSEGVSAWLEQKWGFAIAGVAMVAALLLASYFYGLPAAAERVSRRIPVETEAALGEKALAWLDRQWFRPTKLEGDRQAFIIEGFEGLRENLPLKDHYRLEFRNAEVIGPNAFALPGGIIVITDEMVKAAETDEEVLAILAHEIGHVEMRHSLRTLLQNSAVALIAATVTADAASLSVAVAGLPTLIAQTRYSREFEIAADDFAFGLLKEKGYSPASFAAIMERLGQKHDGGSKGMFAYISTHPVTMERVKKARSAAD